MQGVGCRWYVSLKEYNCTITQAAYNSLICKTHGLGIYIHIYVYIYSADMKLDTFHGTTHLHCKMSKSWNLAKLTSVSKQPMSQDV